MSSPVVSLHPYFQVHPGKLEEARALLLRFVEKTRTEAGCLNYDFTVCDHLVFCRESYKDAAATLAHLENVDALLKEMLTLSDLARLELHGPAAELEKLKNALGGLNPQWFAFACGI